MRLREDKVARLAAQVADRLQKLEDVKVLGDRQSLEHHIREAILDDLAAEDDLEAEVKEMLEAGMRGMARDSVNYAELFKKAKKELARKRGLTF